jgi:hypothetical protein
MPRVLPQNRSRTRSLGIRPEYFRLRPDCDRQAKSKRHFSGCRLGVREGSESERSGRPRSTRKEEICQCLVSTPVV